MNPPTLRPPDLAGAWLLIALLGCGACGGAGMSSTAPSSNGTSRPTGPPAPRVSAGAGASGRGARATDAGAKGARADAGAAAGRGAAGASSAGSSGSAGRPAAGPPTATCKPAQAGHAEYYDLRYVPTDNNPAHRLDLYVPKASGPFPTLVWIHGGAWMGGNKDAPAVRYLADRGYVVASVEYRLSPEAKFPAQLHDVKAAIRFLRASADSYKIDPERIGVAGDSAGGHLASLLATSTGVAALEGSELGHASESSEVIAAAPFYGPTDFSRMNEQAEAKGCSSPMDHGGPASPESLLVGCTVAADSCSGQVQAANPIHYVERSDPPFLIQHGALDCTVAPEQSRLLYTALQNANVDSELVIVPNGDHGDAPFDRSVLDRFLDRTLRNCD